MICKQLKALVLLLVTFMLSGCISEQSAPNNNSRAFSSDSNFRQSVVLKVKDNGKVRLVVFRVGIDGDPMQLAIPHSSAEFSSWLQLKERDLFLVPVRIKDGKTRVDLKSIRLLPGLKKAPPNDNKPLLV